MTSRQAPRAGVALLRRLIPDNEPLVGDLVEEYTKRSDAWFWRQVMFVLLSRTIAGASGHLCQRAWLEATLASLAILIVLSFQVVVAGSLLDGLLHRLDLARLLPVDHPEWLTYLLVLSFLAAWVLGHAMSRLHSRSRVATVLVCGVSAALAALATLSFLNSTPTRVFFPSAALQTAAALVFVIGLLVGVSRTSPRVRYLAGR